MHLYNTLLIIILLFKFLMKRKIFFFNIIINLYLEITFHVVIEVQKLRSDNTILNGFFENCWSTIHLRFQTAVKKVEYP